jgi:hypothetical protein
VQDGKNIDQIEAAMKAGRMFAVFELLGTPEGFDVHAKSTAGQTYELGDVIPHAGGGAVLTVEVPKVRGLDPSLPAPAITGIVYWIDASGSHELARGTETFMANLGAPGAYRVEIRITPSHLGPYLRDLGSTLAEKELPWIYTSPFYVE